MKDNLGKIFRKKTEKLVFLDLPTGYFSSIRKAIKKDGKCFEEDMLSKQKETLPVPIFIEDVEKIFTQGREGVKVSSVLKSMAYMMGIDPLFRYNKSYFEWMKASLSDIKGFLSSYAGMEYEKGEYLNTLIILSCAIHFCKFDEKVLLNYAQICKDMINRGASEEEKKLFYEESKIYYKKVLEYNPKNGTALYQIAFFYLNESENKKAKECFEKAKLHMPEYETEIVEDIEKQIEILEESSILERAWEKIKADRPQEAIEMLEDVSIQGKLHEFRKNFILGYAYRICEDYEYAITLYTKAFAFNNQDASLLSELGLCYMLLGDYLQAEELYLSALDLEPYSVELLCNLSMVYFHLRDMQNASSYVRRALDIDDKDEIAISIWNSVKREQQKEEESMNCM